jgi:isocitrate/isopropylmalate dehydrogenase
MSDHEARAREICAPEYFGGVRSNDEQHIRDVAEALRTVEHEALERAAQVADNYARDGRTHKELACETADEIAARIRSLAVKEGEGV